MYGQKVEWSGPALKEASFSGDKAVLTLDHAKGLVAKDGAPSGFIIAGGAADELTIKWNREKYRDIRLRQHVLADLSNLDCSTTLLGQTLRAPILLAPTSNHRFVHTDGELATVRGAGLAETTMVLSSGANTSIEDVVKVATQPVWFQLYVAKDRGLAKALIQRLVG